jgi:M6 family metalloprotease-like protein
MAIPAKRGQWSTITLSDGTKVRVELRGDEHLHYLQAEDGTCYIRKKGSYERVDATTVQTRRAQRQARRRAIYASTDDGLGKYGQMSMGALPSIGEYTIPVVMVQFSDMEFQSTTTVEKMTRYYNEEGYSDEQGCVGSVRDYFKAQSGGMFMPTFDVVGIVTLDKSYKYYGEPDENDENIVDKRLDDLPSDVINAAIEQLGVDFSQYVVPAGDENHSEGVPLLAMFFAGPGEATEPVETGRDYLWPCEWDGAEDPIAQGNYAGVHFNSFFIGNELYTDRTLMGMGVFCHETGHALGLPDFYVTDYSYSEDDAFGLWSIMDCGAYINDARAPVGYTAYEKSNMGWLELKEIGDAEQVILQSPLGTGENSAYIIRHSDTETFIFENRQPDIWYSASLFGSGVMVSRFAYDKDLWGTNVINNVQDQKRALMLTADKETLNFSSSTTNLYGNGVNSIPSLKTLSGENQAVDISNIVKNDDGTITLTIDHTTSGISTIQKHTDRSDKFYTLQGCYAGNDYQQLSRGLYIVNGKKIIVY